MSKQLLKFHERFSKVQLIFSISYEFQKEEETIIKNVNDCLMNPDMLQHYLETYLKETKRYERERTEKEKPHRA